MGSYLAYLRAILCRDGIAQMRRDARIAWDGLSPLSPYRATMLHTEALAFLLELIRGGRFDAYWTSALVYAWAARAALHRGDLDAARDHLGRAAGLRPLLTHALPVVSVQALLELARAYIALGDPDGAHAVLRQAEDIFQQRPNLGVLPTPDQRAARSSRHHETDRPWRLVP
jgi:tetratricopeptide (TPR) repeat protein